MVTINLGTLALVIFLFTLAGACYKATDSYEESQPKSVLIFFSAVFATVALAVAGVIR